MNLGVQHLCTQPPWKQPERHMLGGVGETQTAETLGRGRVSKA